MAGAVVAGLGLVLVPAMSSPGSAGGPHSARRADTVHRPGSGGAGSPTTSTTGPVSAAEAAAVRVGPGPATAPGPASTKAAATPAGHQSAGGPPGGASSSAGVANSTGSSSAVAGSAGSSSAAGPASSASGTACGGEQTLVSDGITWTCTFDSEFTGTSLDTSQWVPVTTAADAYTSGDTACFVDSPQNISVGNGYLSLTARKTATPFTCQDPSGSFQTQYTSGFVASYGLFDQTYGRFEIDAKVPAATVDGLQSSFWLYPESIDGFGPWPDSGEIDIAETYSEYPQVAVPYIHYPYLTKDPSTDTNVVTNDSCTIDANAFNDYVLEWTPTTMTIIYNGQTCLVDHWKSTEPGNEPFDEPFYICLTQALGIGTNAFDPATTPLPATTEIKYVRAWSAGS